MKLSKLLYDNEYKSEAKAEDITVTDIVCDTKELTEGCAFVCIKGLHYNTHKDVKKALDSGACAIICEKGESYNAGSSAPIFEVESSRRALALMCSRFYRNPQKQMRIIGVTGTNGKTSVCHYISAILSAAGQSCAVIGTTGVFLDGRELVTDAAFRTMTTPDPKTLYKTLARVKNMGARYTVMEVSSHALALEKVAPIEFDIGVFTNLSPEHLDFHKDMESYAKAKAKLFRQCRTAIVNADDEYVNTVLEGTDCRSIRCSVTDGDAAAKDIIQSENGCKYTYTSRNLKFGISTKAFGIFGVYNTLLAATVAVHIGISAVIIREILKNTASPKGRMELVSGDGDLSVIIDYAHTERALSSLLSTVRDFAKERKITTLFGCGGDRDKSKRAPMGRTAASLSDKVIITSDNSRTENTADIIYDILSGIDDMNHVTVIEDRKSAIRHAVLCADAGDIILLVGKGHEEYEIDGTEILPFSEREIVKKALAERGKA